MKTVRQQAWATLVALWLATGMVAAADVNPIYNHYMTGYKGYWSFRTSTGQVFAYSYFDIGTDCASFTLDTGYDGHGGYGNCNLYLGYGYLPTATRYLRRSVAGGYQERIQVLNPAPGRYYLRFYAVSNYKACFRNTRSLKLPLNWRSDMLNRVNYERRSRGLAAVSTEYRLQASSQNYANDMAAKHYYGGANHVGSTYANYTFPRRLQAVKYTAYREARENIGYGYTTVAGVMQAWMGSAGHRDSILKSTMRHAGFGLADGKDYYGFRWVQAFAWPW